MPTLHSSDYPDRVSFLRAKLAYSRQYFSDWVFKPTWSEADIADLFAEIDRLSGRVLTPAPKAPAVVPKVYLAGASSELARAEQWMGALCKAGFEVSYDWPGNIRRLKAANPVENALRWAREGVDGIQKPDVSVVWWLFPSPGQYSHGSAFELGYAFARSMKTIVSGDYTQSIFAQLLDHQFTSDFDAFVWLRENFWVPGDPDERRYRNGDR